MIDSHIGNRRCRSSGIGGVENQRAGESRGPVNLNNQWVLGIEAMCCAHRGLCFLNGVERADYVRCQLATAGKKGGQQQQAQIS